MSRYFWALHWIKAWNTIFHFCTKIILVFRVFILIFTTSNHPYTWLAWPWVSSIIYLVVSRNLWARASSLTTSRIFFHSFFFFNFTNFHFLHMHLNERGALMNIVNTKLNQRLKKNTAIVCFDENKCNFYSIQSIPVVLKLFS